MFGGIEGEFDLGPEDCQVPEGSEGGRSSSEQEQIARAQGGPEGDGRAGKESHFFTPSYPLQSFPYTSYLFTVLAY